MTPRQSVAVWIGLLCAVLISRDLAYANQDSSQASTSDWPTMIAKLRQEMQQRPGFAPTRQQLAIAYNNYAVTLGDQGQWTLATQQLEEAIRLDAGNEKFRKNLTTMYMNQAQEAYQQRQADEAMAVLEKALSVDPDCAQAYALRGQIEYERQRLKEAKAAWQRALQLDPSLIALNEQIERVTQELPVESKFERLPEAYFDLRYEEQLERPVGFDVRDVLLDARRAVGSDFSYWPKRKIVILIYSAESFRALRQETPDWVAGQFDGKIRVPLPGGQLNLTMMKQILFHEYTHALIHDLTSGKCPTWLNEGLAEYEGRTQLNAPLRFLPRAQSAHLLVSWVELSDHFSTTLPVDDVGLAYEQSYSIVSYFVQRYGFWRIRHILKALDEGRGWEQALSEEFRQKLSRIESNWLDWLPEFLRTPQ